MPELNTAPNDASIDGTERLLTLGFTNILVSDLATFVLSNGQLSYNVVTEASPFTAEPGTHDGLTRYVRAAGDVTFDNAQPYTTGMAFNIRATSTLSLLEDGVTLTPPAGGTLDMEAGMAAQVVMTGATAGDVIGQTVASS